MEINRGKQNTYALSLGNTYRDNQQNTMVIERMCDLLINSDISTKYTNLFIPMNLTSVDRFRRNTKIDKTKSVSVKNKTKEG